MMVEAKTVLGAESERQQDSRLLQLMDDLSGKLNRTVLIHPMLDLPSSLPNRRIAADIESKASETELLQEFVVEGEHQGQPYSLAVTAILEDKPTPTADVGATVGQAVNVDIGHPVRKAIQDKASKYGEPRIPYGNPQQRPRAPSVPDRQGRGDRGHPVLFRRLIQMTVHTPDCLRQGLAVTWIIRSSRIKGL